MKEILDKKMQLVNKYRFNFTDYTDVLRAIYHQDHTINNWLHALFVLDTITLFIISQLIFCVIVFICICVFALYSLDNRIFERLLPVTFLQWVSRGILFDDDYIIILLPSQLQEIESIDGYICNFIESLTVEDVMNGGHNYTNTLKLLWNHLQIVTNQLEINKQSSRLQKCISMVDGFMSMMGVKT